MAFILGIMPHVFTFTSTSPGLGSGISIASIWNGLPGSCRRAARILPMLFIPCTAGGRLPYSPRRFLHDAQIDVIPRIQIGLREAECLKCVDVLLQDIQI